MYFENALYLFNDALKLEDYVYNLLLIENIIFISLSFVPNKYINRIITLISICSGIIVGLLYSLFLHKLELIPSSISKATFMEDIVQGFPIIILFIILFFLLSLNHGTFNKIQIFTICYCHLINLIFCFFENQVCVIVAAFIYFIFLILIIKRKIKFSNIFLNILLSFLGASGLEYIFLNRYSIQIEESIYGIEYYTEILIKNRLLNPLGFLTNVNLYASILYIFLLFLIYQYRKYICKKINTINKDFLRTKPLDEIKKYFEITFMEKNKVYFDVLFMSFISIISLFISAISVNIEEKVSNIYAEQLVIDKGNNMPQIVVERNKQDNTITVTNYGGKVSELNVIDLFSIKKILLQNLFNIQYGDTDQQIILTGTETFTHLQDIINNIYCFADSDKQINFEFTLNKYFYIHYKDIQGVPRDFIYEMSNDYSDLYLYMELESEKEIRNYLFNYDAFISKSANESTETFAYELYNLIKEKYIENIH